MMSPYAVRKKSRMRFVKFARVGIRQIEDESAYSWALFESWFEMVRHSSVTSSAASQRFDAVAQVIRHRSCSYCSSSSNRFPLLQTSKNQFRRNKKNPSLWFEVSTHTASKRALRAYMSWQIREKRVLSKPAFVGST